MAVCFSALRFAPGLVRDAAGCSGFRAGGAEVAEEMLVPGDVFAPPERAFSAGAAPK